ncbi:MAG: site-specific DNA-methyltransferase [Anaerolineae bacterium]|nr:site-specific DNA-methyltransferase [Anaerolineae bacterium]
MLNHFEARPKEWTGLISEAKSAFQLDTIYLGDSRVILPMLPENSIACSIWSPPYHVGKPYEVDMDYEAWRTLLRTVIHEHYRILQPGGFMIINIADILTFKDPTMPRIMAENKSSKRCPVTREQILQAMAEHPDYSRQKIAKLLGCSEQTVQQRLQGNNVRGGKYAPQTRVHLVGGMLEAMALEASLYLYDRRIWVKDAAWENSQWHSSSYRAVDEFEYLYIFWKPGVTTVDRTRLTQEEWTSWGSRAVWHIPSVRANDDHPAKFPLELPRRLIRLFTKPQDVILDCFIGSGTTAVAAILEGRRYVSIEIEPRYVQLARSVCAQAHQVAAHSQLTLDFAALRPSKRRRATKKLPCNDAVR